MIKFKHFFFYYQSQIKGHYFFGIALKNNQNATHKLKYSNKIENNDFRCLKINNHV